MIEKERLEELIEEGEKIWSITNGRVVCFPTSKRDYFVNRLDGTILYSNDKYNADLKLEKLYETKEDAEWVVKYHTQRLEYFEPPTWEKFEREHKPYRFISKSGLRETIYVFDKNVNNKLLSAGSKFFGKPTKENYIKACEYARSLFLGGEDEKETN